MNCFFCREHEAGGAELKHVPSLGRLDLGRTNWEHRLILRTVRLMELPLRIRDVVPLPFLIS